MKAKWKENPYVCGALALFVVIAASMIFYRIISDFTGFGIVLSTVARILLPFIVGLALAYLLAPIYDFVQRPFEKWFNGKKKKNPRAARTASRVVASIAAVVFLLAVVSGLLSLVLPQAYQSITRLINTLPDKSREALAMIDEISKKFGVDGNLAEWLSTVITDVTKKVMSWAETDLLPNLGNIAKDISTGVIGVIGTVADVLIGVIICVYTLNSKELFCAQAKKITYSLFKIPTANYIVHMTRYIDVTFGRYINGMLLDALLLGTICFIVTSILQMPYALLISAMTGLFNIVPIFGPIVGAVIGTFFVLLESPIKALIFLLVALVLNQVDGNIIAPKILGDKTGLSGFWVIFAIVVFGGLFGLLGMILAVPMFAVVYTVIRQFVARRLQKKHIPVDTGAYNKLWQIDEVTGEPLYDDPKEQADAPTPPQNDHQQ